MADGATEPERPPERRQPLLPAWTYVLATVFAAGIVVAIAVVVTTSHPKGHATGATATGLPPSHARTTSHHHPSPTQTTDPSRPNRATVTSTTSPLTTSTSIVSTTTTTNPSTTTTPSTTAPASTVAATKFSSGNLAEPFTSTALEFTTAAGPVDATVTWSGGVALHVTLRCAGASSGHVATSGTYLSVAAASGTCTLGLAERDASQTLVSYNVAIDYRKAAG